MNGVFDSFDSFNNEFSPGNRLIDIFPSCFSFYLSDRKSAKTRKIYLHKLNEIVFNASTDSKTTIVILGTSIKNHVAMFITHIYIYDSSVIKTIHHAINITSTEAELFTIRCGLNQATWLTNIEHIIVITDFIHVVKKIFDLSIHLYQIQTLAISKEIRKFFKNKLL